MKLPKAALLPGLLVLCSVPQSAIHAAVGKPIGQAAANSVHDPGSEVYASHCAMCHGKERQGNPPVFPTLVGIKSKYSDEQIAGIVHNGNGRMPAVANLSAVDTTALLHFLGEVVDAPPQASSASNTASAPEASAKPSENKPMYSAQAEAGKARFQQNCAFCHGRDAMGGESGPDLTRSKLVVSDSGGDKISVVVRNGRIEKKMPAFSFSREEMAEIVAFLHAQVAAAAGMKGGRRGVDVADLQTGDATAGKQYFDGAGTCAKCHSATGDLAGVATRYEGLQLEERMLYPKDVKSKVSVTLPSGKAENGTLAYLDEFTVALRDAAGVYHSYRIGTVKYAVDAPVEAHAELFGKYTDADVHNLMAYLQTLR